MGVPGAYPGPRIYPPDLRWRLQRRLYDQLEVECVSREFSGAPATVRASLPAAGGGSRSSRSRSAGSSASQPTTKRHRRAAARRARDAKRQARRLRRSGPASLTVARDLAAIGYEVVVFDSDSRAGGMMRSQIPKFRLPDEVIDEEVGYALSTGGQFIAERRIDSLKALIGEGYDAIFVGCGAPRGRNLDIPGRKEAASHIHIGIDWLSSVSFGHISTIGRRVVVLGGGNTAMDCCRTARRLGGAEVTVVVRSGFAEMKASPWEKEDAVREGVAILNFLAPKAFTHENGRLTGVTFEKMAATKDERGRRVLTPTGEPDVTIDCDDVLIAVGQENAFPWIETRHGPRLRPRRPAGRRSADLPVEPEKRLLRRRRRFRAQEHHHRRRPRPRGGDLDRRLLPRRGRARPAPADDQSREPEDGHSRMVLRQRDHPRPPVQGSPCREHCRAEEHQDRGRARLRSQAGARRSAALPQLRRPDPLLGAALHRVRRLRRRLPDRLHLVRAQRAGARAQAVAGGARPQSHPGDLCLGAGQDPPGHGQGRGSLPALRALRRTLPDRRLGHDEIHHRNGASRTPNADPRCKRLRHSLRQRQRLGIGKRESPVRPLDPADGRADRAAQHLPLQHSGPADLVRSAGERRRVARRARGRGHSGRDESADLRAGCRGARARRLSLLRFHEARRPSSDTKRHRGPGPAADRDLRRPI